MQVDVLWVTVSAALVFLMQAGFLTLESGFTRSKNNINVAMKNITDFAVTTVIFWMFGYALMFGASTLGWFGSDTFFISYDRDGISLMSFFLFQVMFCGTAVTIISGAVAERARFGTYVILSVIVAGFIYPIFGHWAWNGLEVGEAFGWLGQMGFVDFAGSTVVHSVGGWAALAMLLILGPRNGRFAPDGSIRQFSSSNLPLAVLGTILLWLGWFGFNGGSTLAFDDSVTRILTNTVIAGSAGLVAAELLSWAFTGRATVDSAVNGSLAGLVAITANCHAVTTGGAVFIGAIGGVVMLASQYLMNKARIDDAVGAVPVHLVAGAWGTIALALFGQPELIGTGLSVTQQLVVQVIGVVACGVWTFGVTFVIMSVINRIIPLRVSAESEHIGLNVAEHGARSDLVDLLAFMEQQTYSNDLSARVHIEPFTEVGLIAERYNQVLTALQRSIAQTNVIVQTAMDGIITFTTDSLRINSMNPAAEAIFGYSASQLIGKPLTKLINVPGDTSQGLAAQRVQTFMKQSVQYNMHQKLFGKRADGGEFPLEVALSQANLEGETFYTGVFRDITDREQISQELLQMQSTLNTALEAKGRFLVETTERLRDPLYRIVRQTESLLFQSTNLVLTKSIEEILSEGNALIDMFDRLSDASAVATDTLILNPTQVDIQEVLNSAIQAVNEEAYRKNTRLTLHMPADGTRIIVDRKRFRQVVSAMIQASLEYTNSGRVLIATEFYQNGTHEWLEIKVSDNGVGLSDRQLEFIASIEQLTYAAVEQYSSPEYGLGLSLHLAQLMGGSLEIDSRQAHGSTYTLTVPTGR